MSKTFTKGDQITYQPKNGGTFPTGERTRTATVEAVRGDEIIIRQPDGFTNRITESQLV